MSHLAHQRLDPLLVSPFGGFPKPELIPRDRELPRGQLPEISNPGDPVYGPPGRCEEKWDVSLIPPVSSVSSVSYVPVSIASPPLR